MRRWRIPAIRFTERITTSPDINTVIGIAGTIIRTLTDSTIHGDVGIGTDAEWRSLAWNDQRSPRERMVQLEQSYLLSRLGGDYTATSLSVPYGPRLISCARRHDSHSSSSSSVRDVLTAVIRVDPHQGHRVSLGS
jgi:hypothetical protein